MTVSISNSLPDNSLPCGWQKKPFSDVIFDLTGGQPKVQQRDYDADGRLPVIDQGQAFIGGYTSDLEMKCQVQRPCILFGDHTRIFKWVDQPFAIGADGVKVLSTHNNLLPKFAYHFLHQARLPDDQGYSRHFKFLKRLEIPIPPLPEQRRIADILDKADAIRRKQEKGIWFTEELLRSTFLEMFGDPAMNPKGWPIHVMGEVVKDTQYGTAEKSNSAGTGIPVLRMNNITYGGDIDLSNIKWSKIKETDFDQLTVKRGDLLFNRTNSPELVGKTAVWDRDEPYAYAGYLFRVRFDEKVAMPDYISAFLNSAYGKKMLFAKAKPSNNMSNLSAGEFCRIELPVPDIALQRRFSKTVAQTKHLKAKQVTAWKETESLFGSLVQRAFQGEL